MDDLSPIAEVIARRRSCRKYKRQPLTEDDRRALTAFIAGNAGSPFGGRTRFLLVAATEQERAELKGLGTYGFIDGAAGFLVGAVERGPRDYEDYGYQLECAILRATALGLGTCWLGGTFTKSGFARRIALGAGELMPAVAAVGYALEEGFSRDRIRRMAGSNARLPAAALFFDGSFGAPLAPGAAGAYAGALEAVRWAPSASNRQPWRLLRTTTGWHFSLARTKGYGKGTLLFAVLRLADLQRVDMGIAMCHFALVARAAGLTGGWVIDDPGIAGMSAGVEYTATWRPSR